MNTLPTLQGAAIRTLSSRAHWAPALGLTLAALLALTLALGQMQTAQAQGPTILFVDGDALGANDGSSWKTPSPSFRARWTSPTPPPTQQMPTDPGGGGRLLPGRGQRTHRQRRGQSFRMTHDNAALRRLRGPKTRAISGLGGACDCAQRRHRPGRRRRPTTPSRALWTASGQHHGGHGDRRLHGDGRNASEDNQPSGYGRPLLCGRRRQRRSPTLGNLVVSATMLATTAAG